MYILSQSCSILRYKPLGDSAYKWKGDFYYEQHNQTKSSQS